MGRFIFVSLGLLAVAFSLTGAKRSCHPGWYFRNSHCYMIFKEQKSWKDAQAVCKKHRGYLISLRSRTETDDIADYLAENLKSDQSVWIGLHDPRKKGEWEWISKRGTDYMAWADHKPDRSKTNQFCAKLEKDTRYYQWSDSNCKELYPFLCQYL